jgi:hypothetical protein
MQMHMQQCSQLPASRQVRTTFSLNCQQQHLPFLAAATAVSSNNISSLLMTKAHHVLCARATATCRCKPQLQAALLLTRVAVAVVIALIYHIVVITWRDVPRDCDLDKEDLRVQRHRVFPASQRICGHGKP